MDKCDPICADQKLESTDGSILKGTESMGENAFLLIQLEAPPSAHQSRSLVIITPVRAIPLQFLGWNSQGGANEERQRKTQNIKMRAATRKETKKKKKDVIVCR